MADPAGRPLRIGNCSGFYGDRLSAMREMLEGGPLDVLTGDYLAELTMLILGRDQLKDPALGYARTFVRQVEECLGLALERGVRIVGNAGGLNPAGLAAQIAEIAAAQGLSPDIAYVDGDDVRSVGFAGRVDGERLPRRVRHRRGATRRRRHRGHRAGHRRVARRRPGRLVARLEPDGVRRAGRRRGRGARARVRVPGHGRQLLGVPLDGLERRESRSTTGVSARRDRE